MRLEHLQSVLFERCLLFETVLICFNHELDLSSQRLSGAITYETLNRPTVAEEDHCWGSHHSESCGELIVFLIQQDVQSGEFHFSGEFSS